MSQSIHQNNTQTEYTVSRVMRIRISHVPDAASIAQYFQGKYL